MVAQDPLICQSHILKNVFTVWNANPMLILKVPGSFGDRRAKKRAWLQVQGEMHLLHQGKNAGLGIQITEFSKYTQLVYIHPAAPADCQNTL